jgi:protein-L-isoaspartate(D-aspartate) O-methyltransferase
MRVLAQREAPINSSGDRAWRATPVPTSSAVADWIDRQLKARDITDERALAAMEAVPRAEFVPEAHRREATDDGPLPIGFGQTISQPYIVAWMTQELDVRPGLKVLEIGTGSGYQTAILAELGADVYSLEIIPELSARARETLDRLGYGPRVHLRVGSGYDGWADIAPFDRILLTAAPPEIPARLVDQLADPGILVAPVGTDWQNIVIVQKERGRTTRRESIAVRFVPMK